MDAFYLLNIQTTFSLVVFAMIARWYVHPALAPKPLSKAIKPLLFVHVFRYTPMTLFAPGQVAESIPQDVASAIAYGDLLSALLAFLAIMGLRYSVRAGVVLTWMFTIVGIGDIIMALLSGIGAELYQYELGFNWYILNFYVPMLIVTHIMIIYYLIKKRGTPEPAA